MGSLYSVQLMRRKGAFHTKRLEKELTQSDTWRQDVLLEIEDSKGAIDAIQTLESYRAWLGNGRPNAEMREVERVCESAIASGCCEKLRRGARLEAEQMTNRAKLKILTAADVLVKNISYLTDYQTILKIKSELDKELARKNLDNLDQRKSSVTFRQLGSSAEWKSNRRVISRLAGKVAFADPRDRSAIAQRMQVASLPASEQIERLVNNALVQLATNIEVLGV